ncbi:MFS general substrate transporter [Punctularia strigosozonata HHB-11173 SS5]|uniref:MFS general substrate transporter n=1 Tax=Punctularia strigosozonata (strain HHB-11173) TaxID=741275 RepID=UPI00044185B4|nr:MFS general substrate transporter [Punctularia strigosozonata HHB-11173 SS5]EIN06459.1 MFS general substrate transporter [Punctularia strigosozonata HHB-11173 SS5]
MAPPEPKVKVRVSETTPLLQADALEPQPTDPEVVAYETEAPAARAEGRDAEENGDEVVKDAPTGAALFAIVLPLSIGVFLVSMDGTIVASCYASIGSELNQLQNTSWIASAYMLTMTSFQPLYGKLADIFGRKPCLLFAYTIFGLGCLWCGLARSMPELILARAFAGVGGGGMSTVVSIIMSDIVPLRNRGTWQGIINIIWASGGATGAPLGGVLSDTIGWRWAFILQFPATLLAFTSVSLLLHLPSPSHADFFTKLRRIDFLGSALLVFAVSSLLLALDNGGNVSWAVPSTLVPLLLSILLFALLVFVETNPRLAKEPLAPSRIVGAPHLLAAYLCNFFGMAAAMAATFTAPLYLQAARAFTPTRAGLTLLPGVLAGVTGSLSAGIIMQKTGRFYALTIVEYASLTLGALIIALWTGALGWSYALLLTGFVCLSLGNGGGITSTLIALIANAGAADQAIATAVSYLFRSLGSVVGVSVGGSLVQDALRQRLRQRLPGHAADEIVARVRESLTYVDTLPDATRAAVRSSYEDAAQVAFWFAVGMAACAFVSSWFMKEKPLPGRAPAAANGTRTPETSSADGSGSESDGR